MDTQLHTPSHASPGLSERERRNPKIRPSLDPTRRGLQGLLMGLATPRRVTYDDGCPGSKCSVVVHFLPDGRVCRSCLCRCSNVKPCLTACLAVRRLDGRGLGLTCVPKKHGPYKPEALTEPKGRPINPKPLKHQNPINRINT